MRRTVRFHPPAALAGLATALTGCLVAAVVLAAPGSAVVVAAPGAVRQVAATTAAPTAVATTNGPVTTPPPATTSTGPCPTFTSPAPWPNGVGPSWTFENGLTGTWSARTGSGVTLGVTTEAAAGGVRSLRVDGVTPAQGAEGWVSGMPSVSWFRVTARVRAAAGSSPAYITLSTSVTATDNRRPMTRRVTSDGWTELVTYFKPDQQFPPGRCSGLEWLPAGANITITASTACPDAPTGPVSVYVDDVAVTQSSTSTVAPPTSTAQLPDCGTPPSSPVTTSAMQCTASHQLVADWSGGYQANLVVRNMTATPQNPWSLKVTLPGDGQIFSLWGAGSWAVSGGTVTADAPSWSPSVPAGGSLSIGYVRTGAGSPPTSVLLNGMPCVVGTQG